MPDHSPAAQQRHQRFVERAIATGEVWVLAHRDDEGAWATSQLEITAANGTVEALPVVPVWSDHADAERCAQGPWEAYAPQCIALDEFIEHALQGLHDQGVLVGTNWTAALSGHDLDAAELAHALAEAAAARGG